MHRLMMVGLIGMFTLLTGAQVAICIPEMVDLKGRLAIGQDRIYYAKEAKLHIYDRNGVKRVSTSLADTGIGHPQQPDWVWAGENLITYTSWPNCLQIYSTAGVLLQQINMPQLKADQAGDLCLGPEGRIYVSYEGNEATIAEYSTSGKLVRQFSPRPGNGNKSSLLTCDPDGNIYQLFTNRKMIFRKFTAQGKQLYEKNFGEAYGKDVHYKIFEDISYVWLLFYDEPRRTVVAIGTQVMNGNRKTAMVIFESSKGDIKKKIAIRQWNDGMYYDRYGNRLYMASRTGPSGGGSCLIASDYLK